MKKHPGRSRLKVILVDQIEKLRVQMKTIEKGFEMNDEMADFLEKSPEIEVQVDIL
jgi:DNA polymerase-3 subunit alpha